MSLLVSRGTIIDGVADGPTKEQSIWIEGGRIKAVARCDELRVPSDTKVVDARGKYVIPGLMNANVHLLLGISLPGDLLRYMDCFEDVAAEAAQLALKNGLTTVFDTAGQRRPLTAVRDRINVGELPGSRIFCAGWIIGLDGLLSLDFNSHASEVFPNSLVERINGLCVENVGPALSWMTPEQVLQEVRTYIGKGIDFIKYASNEHRGKDPTTSLLFSPRIQSAVVEEAHRASITAQAHTSSVEGLRVAIGAGCDLIQHCNITGPVPIPESTLDLIVQRNTGAVVFPFTQRRFEWMMANCEAHARMYFSASDMNCRNLLRAGAMLLLANDGVVRGPDFATDSRFKKQWVTPGEDDLNALDEGHFVWLRAMEEKGMAPMEMLRAATRNIAVAYGKDKDLGTLEAGKIADLLILDKNPLESAENYRSIHMVLKDGAVVDRGALPTNPILTRPIEPPSAETLAYRAHRDIGGREFPICPLCM